MPEINIRINTLMQGIEDREETIKLLKEEITEAKRNIKKLEKVKEQLAEIMI